MNDAIYVIVENQKNEKFNIRHIEFDTTFKHLHYQNCSWESYKVYPSCKMDAFQSTS